MLRTGCVFSKRTKEDGIRVVVMNRNTEHDGETPILSLAKGIGVDAWVRFLSVPGPVVGAYYAQLKKPDADQTALFNTLADAYRTHLATNLDAREQLQYWSDRAITRNVTFLCYEETTNFCHRRILAEECKKYRPDLAVYLG